MDPFCNVDSTACQDALNPTAVGLQPRLWSLIRPILCLSVDDIVSYGYQGCSSVCYSMTMFNKDVALEEKCCSDSSFCNKF